MVGFLQEKGRGRRLERHHERTGIGLHSDLPFQPATLCVKLVTMAEACGGRKNGCSPGLNDASETPTTTNAGTVLQAEMVVLKGVPIVGSGTMIVSKGSQTCAAAPHDVTVRYPARRSSRWR